MLLSYTEILVLMHFGQCSFRMFSHTRSKYIAAISDIIFIYAHTNENPKLGQFEVLTQHSGIPLRTKLICPQHSDILLDPRWA